MMRLQVSKHTSRFNTKNSIYTSQCIMAAVHFLAYNYFKDVCPESVSCYGLLTSLIGFVVPLLLSDLDTFRSSLPSTYATALALPGSMEFIDLIMSVMWMIFSLYWLVAYPDPASQTILAQSAPAVIATLSFTSWLNWTASFIF